MPSDRDHVFEGDMLVVDCKPGYKPHFMVARCLETGVFDFEVDCKGNTNFVAFVLFICLLVLCKSDLETFTFTYFIIYRVNLFTFSDRGNVTRPVNTFKGLNFTQVIISKYE